MVNNITNKNILFFCTKFYSYYEKICAELEMLGASEVTFVEIPFFKESFRYSSANIRTLVFWFAHPYSRTNWTKNVLIKECEGKHFDMLFCIGDVPFKIFFFDWIKKNNPSIKSYLFLWDKLSVVHVPKDIIEKFDYKFSFDRDDCKSYMDIEYLPNFYIEDKQLSSESLKYDISFIGTFTGIERGNVLHELKNFCNINHLSYFLFLYRGKQKQTSNILKKLYRCLYTNKKYEKIIEKYKSDSFIFSEKMPLSEVEKIQAQSRCLLDMSYSDRQGLTLNAVYAIAKGKKLITANRRIIDETFYHPENIYVFDPKKPIFNIEFFKTYIVPMDMLSLRLDNWLKFILKK